MAEIPERSEIDDSYTWNLDKVYADRDVWEADYAAAEEYLEELQRYEGRVTDNAETLHEALLLKDQISRKIGKLSFYAKARLREDMRRDEYQEMVSRVESLSSESGQVKSFIKPEIQDASRESIAAMVDEHPPLDVYDKYLDEVFRYAEHNLGQEKEELVSQISEVLGNERDIHNKLMNADIAFPTVATPDGEDVTVTHSNRIKLLKNPDRDFRQRVYEAYADTWSQFENTLASNYANKVKNGVIFADIRGYDSVRKRKMKSDKIPEDVYDTLLDVVHENADAIHRQKELIAELWDLDTLHPWDTYLSLAQSDDPEIEYEGAKEYVLDALQPLGDDYVDAAAEGLDAGWVDVYANKGKRSGAFSWGTYDTEPFLFMNYEDDIDSMYTLAHELGHTMHSFYANNEQPYQHASYPTFTAEVASTVNEALLTNHLLETVDDEDLRQHILSQQLKNIRGTLFTQAMFADFEHRVHETAANDKPLTAERLNTIYGDVRKQFDTDRYEPSEYSDKGWMCIPHFYRPYYVYQYATGISAALALSQQITDNADPEAAERYRDFLKSGGSEFPIPLLQEAGVDLTDPDPIEDAIDEHRAYLDEMAALV